MSDDDTIYYVPVQSNHWDAVQAELKELREGVARVVAVLHAIKKGGHAAGMDICYDDPEFIEIRRAVGFDVPPNVPSNCSCDPNGLPDAGCPVHGGV